MLTLYIKIGCPFCEKVLRFASEQGIELVTKDIYAYEAMMAELIIRGGKRQVPYLVDDRDGTEMYESDDIIDYLRNNYANQG